MTIEEAIRELKIQFVGEYDRQREAKDMAIKALEQEPCEDVISRKADNLCSSCTNIGCAFQSGIVRTECAFYIPPHIEPDNCGNYVIQEPKTGHWINIDETHSKCDRCWAVFEITSPNGEVNYCPNCGAKMERSDKK